jgi:hypothetical protein
MKILIFAFILGVLCFSSCSITLNKDEQTGNRAAVNANAESSASQAAESETTDNKAKNSEPAKNVFGGKEKAKTECENINTGDKALLKSQTFPIDFAPYKNSCFVTAHDPEYTDPPLNSEFSIYRGGEEVFFFPGQFNGVTTGCWVEAVSFQDLNGDNLIDIIVVGKCGAKSGPYHENMVYVNTGTTFMTDENANYKLADFQKAGEISDFVKRNKQLFF